MSGFKQRTIDFLEIEWGTYIERFNRWPKEEGAERVRKQGYDRFQDMLAHILAWWEEGMPIITAIAENREYPRKKYDFDAFNAEAVSKYKDWDEGELLVRFEKMRQDAAASLRSMDEAAFENRRLRAWVNGIFISHAREHLVALSRFLALDVLENEWATYVDKFNQIEDKAAFLQKQGVGSLNELLGHMIGWWEAGMQVVHHVNAGTTWQEPDTDEYNRKLIETYSSMPLNEVTHKYEAARLQMIELVKSLPDDAFLNREIEGWLAADVVQHYDDHPIA